eukprot:TRINITY_DN796_c0_g1_i6.p1 TRINITY_DN796_c0_g1~~TRINITY_DN796_c0_g1_i6.p1  ORF type:complete len:526 (-),score=139.81 TRINITY_DN796_c0_g1_i6:22-1599(-)
MFSLLLFFFFNDTATTEIYTILFVGSVRCVQETGTWGKTFSKIQELVRLINQEQSLNFKEKKQTEIEIIDIIGDLSAKGKGQFTRVTQSTTPIERKNAGDSTQKSQEELALEKEILELTGSSLTIFQRIYKIIKITSMLKKQLTVLSQYQFSIKQEIQKFTVEQFSIKMQLGIAKVEWDIYAEKIRVQRIEYEKFKQQRKLEKMNEIAIKINSLIKQLQVPKAKVWDLQQEYDQLQQKIEEYLKRLNSVTEKIIVYKKQLIYYEVQQRKLEDIQLKIEKEANEKKKMEQIKIKQTLRSEKIEADEIKKQIKAKTTERDIACTKPKTKKRDFTWLNNDYGWSKFIKIRIEASKRGQYVESKTYKKNSFAKGAFDDGVFRIRQKLNQILLFEIQRELLIGGNLFKKIKSQVDIYVKVLQQSEALLKKNEIIIQKRILIVQEQEIEVKKNAQIITDDLEKCKLGFPKIKQEAKKLKGRGVIESIHKDANKIEKQLKIISNKNREEESCLLYTSPSPRDRQKSRMPSSA